MSTAEASRRAFLQVASTFAGLGDLAMPFGVNLAAVGAAAAQASSSSDYKALVCVFLLGGNDAANMVLPTDADSWTRYLSARDTGSSSISLPAVGMPPAGGLGTVTQLGGVLPIVPRTPQSIPAGTSGAGTRTFALHPALPKMQGLFNRGKLAIVANVGTLIQPVSKSQNGGKQWVVPRALFSHGDQANLWQSGTGESARYGWAGQMADLFVAGNATPLVSSVSTSISAVLLSGRKVGEYQVGYDFGRQSATPIHIYVPNGTSYLGSAAAPAIIKTMITSPAGNSYFQRDHAAVVLRSLNAETALNAAFAGVKVTPPSQYVNPLNGRSSTNLVATQLQSVAQFIAARQAFGTKRQVFFVGVGGFDTHTAQSARQPDLMAQLDHALDYFYATLQSGIGADMTANVTTFTMSDFGRTFSTNGGGTDHGWGSHQLIMGGAVKGGDIYNQFPTMGADVPGKFDNPNALVNGVLIPTYSVDQYASTLGSWFGVSGSDLGTIFPNLINFSATQTFI